MNILRFSIGIYLKLRIRKSIINSFQNYKDFDRMNFLLLDREREKHYACKLFFSTFQIYLNTINKKKKKKNNFNIYTA